MNLVIIGAGMAGIKLAHELLLLRDDDSLQITILEANNYIGGRIYCREFQGTMVECGANWISGLEERYNNPVWELAKQVSLRGEFSDRDNQNAVLALDATSGGEDVTDEYMQTLQEFNQVYEKAIDTCAKRGIKPQNDVNVASLLQECGWKPQSNVEKCVEYNVLQVWVANDLSTLSAAHDLRPGMNDVDLGQEEVFVQDSRGFNTILGGMVQDIKARGGVIHLNCQVERVQYTPGRVQVTARDLTIDKVIEYPADAVVCTASIGVLQNDKITFDPPFPEWKQRALNQIGMFCFAKVFCQFHPSFQPPKDQFAICSETKGHYPFWMKYKHTNNNLYMCYVGGDEAERVEALTEEQIKDEIEQHFRRAFGNTSKQTANQDASIFRPAAVAVTNWSTNPQFCGSYSWFPVHAFANVPEADLTSGLTGTDQRNGKKTLYFAGEGFDDKFNGWVQGAYRSGEQVAKWILDDYSLNQS